MLTVKATKIQETADLCNYDTICSLKIHIRQYCSLKPSVLYHL